MIIKYLLYMESVDHLQKIMDSFLEIFNFTNELEPENKT